MNRSSPFSSSPSYAARPASGTTLRKTTCAPALRKLMFAAGTAAVVAACAPTPAPPPPAPSPEAVRDSIRRADSLARAEVERARLDSIRRAEEMAREAAERARLDSIARVRAAQLRVCGGGDVMLGSNLDTTWATRASQRFGRRVAAFPDPDVLLAPLRPLVEDADVILFNVEGAIGEGPAPPKCRPGSTQCYAFRQPVAAADALARFAGEAAMVGNLANNHSRDAGEAGFVQTRRHLERAGVHVTGGDTLPTIVTARNGEAVAILGFHTAETAPDARDLDAVRRHVSRAAAEHRRVVVTMHIGAEGARAQRTGDSTEMFLGTIDRGNPVAFARAATESGADLVIGHGPHVLRAMEWHGEALVIYSLGNLLTYGPFTLSEPNNRGAVVCATLDGEGWVLEAALRSTVQVPPGIVRPDPGAHAAALIDSLTALDFPETGARVRADGAIVRIPVP
ncbi:MAG TPA: CapA family protein [Gemmatimonadaceae bacterium]|nr:CapA family protein [Gemmatimonadaceae bacterium]